VTQADWRSHFYQVDLHADVVRICRIACVVYWHAYVLARMFTRSLKAARGFVEASSLTPPASQIAD